MNRLFLIFLFSISFATIITVDDNGPADYSTIQDAIDVSVDGDTVLVHRGFYQENILINKSITLASHAIYDNLTDLESWTFYDDNAQHFDRTSPFDSDAMSICSKSLSKNQGDAPQGIIVAQCIGPQFESPAEISALERLGADTVGMTLGPESRLISESGIPHVALACSSNWAAGRDPTDPRANIDHHSVDRLASTMRELVTSCIKSLLIEYSK